MTRKMSIIIFILLIFYFHSCTDDKQVELPSRKNEKKQPAKRDIDIIRERGKLRALTGFNATSYFIYRGQPMGYEYELLNKLCDHLGVKLELVIVSNIDSMITKLNEGDGDILA